MADDPGDQALATMNGAAPLSVPSAPFRANSGASTFGSSSQFNVLPEKIVVLPFTPPQNFELTKANASQRIFTQQDRDVMAAFPMRIWQQVITV